MPICRARSRRHREIGLYRATSLYHTPPFSSLVVRGPCVIFVEVLNMKRVFRQWLAGLLSVVLVFTLLPAMALAEEADGATGPTAVEQVQALIDALPDTEEITAETRDDVQAQIDAIDAAMVELTGDEAAALDTARYDAAVAALLALDALSALERVQDLIDALPDADAITTENRADVEEQLNAIDEAKLALEDEELDALDITVSVVVYGQLFPEHTALRIAV